jgi:flagellar export protein FliJ
LASDRLHLLLTIRQRDVDEAMKVLAACIAAEQAAVRRVAALSAAIEAERGAVDRGGSEPPDLEAFARWSGWARTALREALGALAQAEAHTAPARAALAEARSAARAVEELIALRAREADAKAARQEAHALDDLAGRLHRDRKPHAPLQ